MGLSRRFYLGFDGGQSGSRAIVSDAEGHVITRTSGPPFDHIKAQDGRDKIRSAFARCLGTPEIRQLGIVSAFLGLTGIWQPNSPEVVEVREILGEVFTADLIECDNDSVSCWAGALGGRAGVVVAAGTGVVAYGRDESGAAARLGGWGYIMGDCGGAYDIGRRALRAVAASADAGAEDGILVRAILAHFAVSDARSLQACLYSLPNHRQAVAGCSRIVCDAAEAGDEQAMAILDDAGAGLGTLATAAAARLGWASEDDIRFSMAGGVFRSGPVLTDAYQRSITSAYPTARICRPLFEPVVGALLLAWAQAGVDMKDPLRIRTLAAEVEGCS